jgi:hypothetical protein
MVLLQHFHDKADKLKKKAHILDDKVNLILLSENSLMSAEKDALSTLSTLDLFSSVVILAFIFSMLPVI